jgi:alpha-tubulin suppressor-like RCC1 family protein
MVDVAGAAYASDVRYADKMEAVKIPGLEKITKVRTWCADCSLLIGGAQIACGLFHSVALSDQGDVYMWAEDGQPQLIDFFSGRAVCDVAAGQIRTYAVTEDGAVYLWERDPVGGVVRGPELVRELSNVSVARIACGDGFTLALSVSWRGETQLWSWGRNTYGQLGKAEESDMPSAIKVLEGEFCDIACGGFHAAVVGGRYIGARSSLAADLLSALQSKFLADVTFVLATGGATVPAHRLMLLSRVPTFLTLVGGLTAEQITVPAEITQRAEDFVAVLGFLCGGEEEISHAHRLTASLSLSLDMAEESLSQQALLRRTFASLCFCT